MFNINGYDLDQSQINAIMCDEKATIVNAGAGAGKTLTILGKIKYLIENKNIKEDEILCISFTNETVNSLNNKIKKLGYNVPVYTFHKLGLKFLNNINISNDSLLDYIIDEYFKSYFKSKLLKRILFKEHNMFNSLEYIKLKNIISTFINLAKSNDYKLKDIFYFYEHAFFNEKIILHIILDIYLIYERELESTNSYDFNDLISKAKLYVSNSNINYKYIIIDEFQDTSQVRFNLILEIVKKCNSKLFLVGDDWQSIYRFSGCDLNLFINLKNIIPNTKYFNLEYTYRNSNEIIYVSSSFIIKNKKQLVKHIKSVKNLDKPIKILFNYTIEDTLKLIDGDVMILGRNNSDISNINLENKFTIHKSKGLECDNVILINSDNIPSKVRNDKILRYVLKEKDYILYEEERRLFYVAMTRTKNNFYILVNKKISPFVKELISDYKDYIEIIKKH